MRTNASDSTSSLGFKSDTGQSVDVVVQKTSSPIPFNAFKLAQDNVPNTLIRSFTRSTSRGVPESRRLASPKSMR